MKRTVLILFSALIMAAIAPLSSAADSYFEGNYVSQSTKLAITQGAGEFGADEGFGLRGWLGIGDRWAMHFETQSVNEGEAESQLLRFGGSFRLQFGELVEGYFRAEGTRLEFDVPRFSDSGTDPPQGREDLVGAAGTIFSLGANLHLSQQFVLEFRAGAANYQNNDGDEIDGFEFDTGFAYRFGDQLALSFSYRELVLDPENNNASALDFRDIRAGLRYYFGGQ